MNIRECVYNVGIQCWVKLETSMCKIVVFITQSHPLGTRRLSSKHTILLSSLDYLPVGLFLVQGLIGAFSDFVPKDLS